MAATGPAPQGIQAAMERARRAEQSAQDQQTQVDPQHVINSYRQRTADLEFELYKRDALIAQLTSEVQSLRTECDNLRAMHADQPEPPEQGD